MIVCLSGLRSRDALAEDFPLQYLGGEANSPDGVTADYSIGGTTTSDGITIGEASIVPGALYATALLPQLGGSSGGIGTAFPECWGGANADFLVKNNSVLDLGGEAGCYLFTLTSNLGNAVAVANIGGISIGMLNVAGTTYAWVQIGESETVNLSLGIDPSVPLEAPVPVSPECTHIYLTAGAWTPAGANTSHTGVGSSSAWATPSALSKIIICQTVGSMTTVIWEEPDEDPPMGP